MPNLITNPSVETDPSAYWEIHGFLDTYSHSTEQALFDTHSLKLTVSVATFGIRLQVANRIQNLTPAGTYTFSVYLRGNGKWQAYFQETDASGNDIPRTSGADSFASPGNDWNTRLVQTVTLGATTVGAMIYVTSTSDSLTPCTAYLDGFQLVAGASPKTFGQEDATGPSTETRRIRRQFQMRPGY